MAEGSFWLQVNNNKRSKLCMTTWPALRRIGVEQEGWLRSDGILRFELDQASGWREHDARLPLLQGRPASSSWRQLPIGPCLAPASSGWCRSSRSRRCNQGKGCGYAPWWWRPAAGCGCRAMPNFVNSSPVSFKQKRLWERYGGVESSNRMGFYISVVEWRSTSKVPR